MRFLTILLLIFCLNAHAKAPKRNPSFPVKGEMRTQVNFWKKVYTEIGSNEAFIHDSYDLSVIYKKIKLKKGRKTKRNQIHNEKNKIKKILRSISRKNFKNLNKEEQSLLKTIKSKNKSVIKRMMNNIRSQSGLRDMYFAGLKRSYAYLAYIEKTFKKYNLPHELTYLPHVESSFNYHAYSKVGAAGIWQFMRSTARLYKLKVNYLIDERRDPIKATVAAARFLKDNYRTLGAWPLALTAYNHGARSVKRAVKKVKSTDINKIIKNYKGRRFGFASRNFYATFMATVEISEEPEKYFKNFKAPPSYRYSTIKLDKPYTPKQLVKNTSLSLSQLKNYNPSIRKAVYKSNLHIPKGFELRIPMTTSKKEKNFLAKLKKIKSTFGDLSLERIYIVSRGENLYDISKIFRVSLNELIRFNNIDNPSKIYAGMKLKIPSKKSIRTVQKNKPIIKKKAATASKSNLSEKAMPLLNLANYELDLKKIAQDIYLLTIETEETLGHYAEWADVNTQSIRNLNGFSFKKTIKLNEQIKVKIKNYESFIQERAKYHLSIQEDFFDSYKLEDGFEVYIVKSGDNLTEILQDLNIPLWLLRKYQKGSKLNDKIFVGQKIKYPKLITIGE